MSSGASNSVGLLPPAGYGTLPVSRQAPRHLVTEVLEYRPYEDGYLQLELRRYIRRDGSARERGPYWYFQYHEGGKRRKLYLGKTSDPESTWPPSGQSPWGSRSLRWPGSARKDEKPQLETFGTSER